MTDTEFLRIKTGDIVRYKDTDVMFEIVSLNEGGTCTLRRLHDGVAGEISDEQLLSHCICMQN